MKLTQKRLDDIKENLWLRYLAKVKGAGVHNPLLYEILIQSLVQSGQMEATLRRDPSQHTQDKIKEIERELLKDMKQRLKYDVNAAIVLYEV